MTVQEMYDEYIKLIPEERTKLMEKISTWYKQVIKENQKEKLKKEQENKNV